MKYVCEICEAEYATPHEAEACEKAHDCEKERLADEKVVNDVFNAYIAKYKAIPEIFITEENKAAMIKERNERPCCEPDEDDDDFLSDVINTVAGVLVSLLTDDEDDDGECATCEKCCKCCGKGV